ncbi:MAG TPA: hypothetical protein VF802_08705, partial [Candidatus Limnocylindrales bacterium]
MAVRLQMRLGMVAEHERLQDSPDRILVVEPTIGSVARSKGNLYLLVTCRQSGKGPREAARFVADAIREQYYYDESAGIRVCIVKAIVAANKRLAHDRDHYGLHLDEAGDGPIGIALAVVRGAELYVATVGPAEAFLVRAGRLSTLPDPHRERGMPSGGIEPEVWRGEMIVDDVLALVSPNLVERLDADELRDAMTTLRPQSAMEHLHHRFVAADGRGSDGAIAIEGTEVAVTQKHVALVPVRPAEPLAGAPDHSPIPLADTVSDGVAAVRGSARSARSAAGVGAGRILGSLLDTLPRRTSGQRRVTSVSSRRETQRRGAIAVIAVTTVVALGAVGLFVTQRGGADADLSSLTIGQRALRQAQSDLSQVTANGVDLVADDPAQAERLLSDAYQQLGAAETAGIPPTTTDPLRSQAVTSLDRLYRMVDVVPAVAFSFANLKGVDLRTLVRGPDDVPYVLDAGTKAVYRVDLKARKAVPVVRMGTPAAGTKVAEPKVLAVGGPDLLILDAKNQLWRWRPADKKGAGTLTRVKVNGAVQWGPAVSAIGTFVRNADAGLYNLYVVDPADKQIQRYSPAADGSGFPAAPSGYLQSPQILDGVVQLYIDGDIFLVDSGSIVRYVSGTARDWKMGAPGDTILRQPPRYEAMASASGSRQGAFYAWDAANDRVVAFDKATGRFL